MKAMILNRWGSVKKCWSIVVCVFPSTHNGNPSGLKLTNNIWTAWLPIFD